jgi:hypothetical protein
MSHSLEVEFTMNSPCGIRFFCIRFRFLRIKASPWVTLAIAPLNLLMGSGSDRIHKKIRCMRAMSKIDFAGFYGLLNDLLW